MAKHIYVPKFGTLRDALFILGLIAALGLGLALVSPARGAELRQEGKGDITGVATIGGQGVEGVTVELRQRTNGGVDALLTSSKTGADGAYHFSDQPSAPNDAFYYVRLLGGKGSLTAWYSFPIIYVTGSEVAVPAVELADVELVAPAQDAALALPGALSWKARKMGETYRVFVYASGKNDKPVLDSGNLGAGTEFSIPDGGLQAGKYEAAVQVRDTVVGYGQSQSRFRFTVGAAAQEVPQGGSESAPDNPPATSQGAQPEQGNATAPAGGEAAPKSGDQKAAQPEIKISLSADKTSVAPGEGMIYKLDVENSGGAPATGVVVTDKLPAGVSANLQHVKATSGQVFIDGGIVTANIGDLAPGSKATIEIPVNVSSEAGNNISNQASAAYNGSRDPVQSNSYIAQVAAPATGPPQSLPQQPVQQPPTSQSQSRSALPQGGVVQAPALAQPQNSAAGPPQAPAEKRPAAPVPQTGGSFPVVLAVLLLLVTLLARYLRGFTRRRA